jgi:hypothetical protein
MSKRTSKLPPLDRHLIKQLLQDLEASDKSLHETDFKFFCSQCERVYGIPGSLVSQSLHPNANFQSLGDDIHDTHKTCFQLRRSFQKKFGYLKQSSISQYIAHLDSFGVAPGSVTLRLQRREALNSNAANQDAHNNDAANDNVHDANNNADANNNTDTNNANDDTDANNAKDDTDANNVKDDEDIEETNDSNMDEEDLVSALDKMSIAPTPPRQSRSAIGRMFSPPRSIAGTDRFSMASPGGSSVHTASLVDLLDDASSRPSGTKHDPYIIHVNLAYPERNGGFFDITHINGIAHKNHDYHGVEIRIDVAVKDYNRWDANIPGPQQYPEALRHRLVLVNGPSQSFWKRNTMQYHGEEPECIATKRAHNAAELEIAKDESRQTSYWLLVFPASISLDNTIFSEDTESVATDYRPLRANVDDLDDDNAEKVHGMVIEWRIAEHGGRRIHDGPGKPASLKNMYTTPTKKKGWGRY